MTGLEISDLQRDRYHLARALTDIESGRIAGLAECDRNQVRELVILRIADIDRLLASKAN
jgi:hypothetical protein